jgi:hypothetical protein
MAISILKTPEIFACCGLSMINPMNIVAVRTASEEYATLQLYQIKDFNTDSPTEQLKATINATFNNQNVAYFEISELLKSFFNPVQDLGSLRNSPYFLPNNSLPQLYDVFVDDRYKFIKYKAVVSGNEFVGYCTFANQIPYNRYYTGFPNIVPNNQVTFKPYTITADDLDIPTYFNTEYNIADYNKEDYN